jgi:hypothetical protein
MIKVIRVLQELETAEIHFRVKQTTQLGKLKRSYSERVGVPLYLLRFLYDGKRIIDEHTPDILEMESGDVIEVYDEMGNGTNSNIQNAGNLQQRRRQLSCSSSISEPLLAAEIKQENIKQEEYTEPYSDPKPHTGPPKSRNPFSDDDTEVETEYEEVPDAPGPSSSRYGYSASGPSNSSSSAGAFQGGASASIQYTNQNSVNQGPLRLRSILRPFDKGFSSSDTWSRKRQLNSQSSQEESIAQERESLTAFVGKRSRLTDTYSDADNDSEDVMLLLKMWIMTAKI